MSGERDPALERWLQATIDAYLNETGGGLVTSWHFVGDFIDADGEQSWLYATPDGQKVMTTIGLIEWARDVARYEQRRHLDEISEGDA